ncbi:MAG TPA: 5-formyltetrahydrofolate cyclo-ligase [Methylomirabilota bacterium]|nr:5-formyltetrahydrofolate cyclo-ligase [Methylomirabilota bacterium]
MAIGARHNPPEDIDAAKRALRSAAAGRRRAAAPTLAHASEAVRDRFLAAVAVPAGKAVSGFWPLADEFDPRPLLQALRARGHRIGLPVVVGRGLPLLFRRWEPGMALVRGNFKVMTPPPDAPEVVPQILLVPLLAFDRAGYRLGYGGGFYDRTLAKLRAAGDALAVGVAFAMQEVPSVPRDDTDQPLDWIVTEREAIAITRRTAGD